MKQFSCGDVVPGCGRAFRASTDLEILTAVVDHARTDHGLSFVPDSMVAQVRDRIVTV